MSNSFIVCSGSRGIAPPHAISCMMGLSTVLQNYQLVQTADLRFG